ncbi:hypothetical protein PN36_30850 [Candidatus Thiomargarita nelsonii]|uniref:Uncharacterized protein n=1 Tax=Candidatus Thiomargarita nelsonii TaxID=1003181 RepID=A0A0A6P6B2_9GAMM|nr:hypothetical protein PN36_30850 [Candidatus Thiomargarita nelsonii]
MPSSHKLEGYLCVVSAYFLKHVIFFPVLCVYDGGGVYPIQLQNVKENLSVISCSFVAIKKNPIFSKNRIFKLVLVSKKIRFLIKRL